jgi:hypothetical protein
MDARLAEPMIILEKQVDLIVYLCQVVDQGRQDRRRVDQVVFEDQLDGPGACALTSVLQGLGHVEQKPRGLIVIRIDGDPRNGMAVLFELLCPSGGEGTLAEAGGRLDDAQSLGRKL